MPEKKAPAKSSAPKAKAKAASTSTSVKAKSEAAPAKAKAAGATTAAAAPVATRGTCTAAKCQRPLRAKGYCRKHFMAWRRGKLGAHHHYKICSKEACRKPRLLGGLCAEHAGKGEPAQAAAAAAS